MTHVAKRLCLVALLTIVARPAGAQVTGQRLLSAERRAPELADVLRQLLEPPAQPVEADRSGQRTEPRTEVGLPGPLPRGVRGDAARRGRGDVPDAAAQRRGGARREDRHRVLDLPAQGRARIASVLWIGEPRPGDTRPDTLYMATIDARLVALDARDGQVLWSVEVAKPASGYSMTLAPLVVKDKVVIGVAGGEFGIRGFLAAHDAATGKEVWRFYTIPAPGEPGNETWPGDSWKTGGAPIWLTGSYDPTLDLLYWGIGNPGPDFNAAQREGKNLYSASAVAIEADTGEAAVVLPVLAERSVRLRRGADSGAGRHGLAGHAAQAGVLGEPQRVLLRARPRHRQVRGGPPVREGQLGERPDA